MARLRPAAPLKVRVAESPHQALSKYRSVLIVLALVPMIMTLFLSRSALASAASQLRTHTLADTTSGIHVALPFDYCYSEQEAVCGGSYVGQLPSIVGKVDAVWGSKQAVIDPSVQTFYYFDADVDDTYRGGPRTVSANTAYEYYVEAGRASWMVFQGGFNKKHQRQCSIAPNVFNSKGQWVTSAVNANLAWESYTNANNIGRIPLDLSNPSVVAFQDSELNSAIQAGYNGIALDSIHLSNPFGRCGVFQQVKGKWVWKPIYASASSYEATMVNWVKSMRADIETINPNAMVSVNYGLPSDADPSVLLPYVDLIFDERGFTKWGTDVSTGSEWTSLVTLINKVQTSGRALLINAEVSATSDQTVSEASILWALANYLLVKGAHTYTYISPTTATTQGYGRFYDRPEYHLVIGQPSVHGTTGTAMYPVTGTACYARTYSSGLVLVNPSPKKSCSIPLSKSYYSVVGHTATGITSIKATKSFTLKPATGAILLTVQPAALRR